MFFKGTELPASEVDECASVGICIGIALGTLFDDVAIGIALGVALGAAYGAFLDQKRKTGK